MKITTFDQLQHFISSLSPSEYYFRGYTNPDELKPNLGRKKDSDRKEKAMHAFCDFLEQLYNKGFPKQTLKDCIAISQHYGIPTKLVDLTIDPWVSVYFGLGREHCNGNFKILYTPARDLRISLSDKFASYTVTLGDIGEIPIESIRNMSLHQLTKLEETDLITIDYIRSHLLEKIYNKFFNKQDEAVLLIYDKTVNLRIARQKGLFVLFRDENALLDKSRFDEVIFDLSSEEVAKVWTYLEQNGYTQDNLLPKTINGISVAEIASNIASSYFSAH